MFDIDINKITSEIYLNISSGLEEYLPKVLGAVFVLIIGVLISIGIYKLVMYIFKKFNLIELIDRLTLKFQDEEEKQKKKTEEKEKTKELKKENKIGNKFSDKIKINEITAKAISYYVFLVFFRYSIVIIGIKDIEIFMGELLRYLPSLFIGVVIGFFGIRFANFIYDVVYHALDLSKQKTAKIIASGAKIIILFFTLMVVLSKIGIDNGITNTILIGFISMLSIAGGLAFGLGGKDIAHEILESFRK